MTSPNADVSVEKYRRAAERYDRRLRLVNRYRRSALDKLDLRPGDTVLDVACGTGANFGAIRNRIGASGQLLGIDLSPDMLERAQRRVAAHGWQNVALVEAAVEDATIPMALDAAFFSLTHDVLQSRPAVQNVVEHLKPGGRVSSFGSKWARRWAVPINLVVRRIADNYVTTFDGFDRPWRLLAEHVPTLKVEPVLLGAAYVAWGSVEQRRALGTEA